MDIRETVIEIRHKRNKTSFIEHFRNHPDQVDALFSLIKNLEPYPYKEYASWVLLHLAKTRQFELQKYYQDLVDLTFETKDQTVLRNVVCTIEYLKITDYRESEFIDQLIAFIQDSKNKVALHVYSIYVLIDFCKKYPELSTEIEEIIELNSEGKSAAYQVARRNFEKEIKNS